MIKLLSSLGTLSKQDKELKRKLKNILGFKPSNLALYKQAFRHRSSKKDISEFFPSNERLEFLGDAILGAVVAEYLFKLFPKKDEGFLTQMRSRMVNGNNLYQLSKKYGFDVLLNSRLTKSEQIGSSAYGDVFEAFIGALFLDKGFEKTKKFIVHNIIKHHLDIDDLLNNDTDYKSQFQVLMQKQKMSFEYKVVNEALVGKHKNYTVQLIVNGIVEAEFEDKSKKAAEQKAAQQVLEKLKQA